MIVVVTGARDYRNRDHVFGVLERINAAKPIAKVVVGSTRGADQLALDWSKTRALYNRVYHASWYQHGRAAGPIRNGEMLRAATPDLVIRFPGGRGTADCAKQADGMGIKVFPATAHRSSRHREAIEKSRQCGCFHCLELFAPTAVSGWTDDDGTALCPLCDVDAVIGDHEGAVDAVLLRAKHRLSFTNEWP